jgi:hypothetical protein
MATDNSREAVSYCWQKEREKEREKERKKDSNFSRRPNMLMLQSFDSFLKTKSSSQLDHQINL